MYLWQVVVLAVIQGLTEFLPISSSAHLILIPWLSHGRIPDPGMAFDVALHAGTLLAVLLYFLREWTQLLLCGLGFHYPKRAPEHQVLHNRRLFWYLVAGTIPGGLVGYFLEHRIEEYLRSPIPIACAMIAIALVMWYAEYVSRLERNTEQISLGDSLAIGAAQALALFPGVSRSGITICAGLFRGMTREAAARFSFLLATPLIAGAAAKELPKLIKAQRAGTLEMPASDLLLGVLVSALVGYIVIAFFLQYLQTRTLKIFIYYRILFGIVVLLLAFLPMGSAR
jgi:undecaprenyl-diphosphatase